MNFTSVKTKEQLAMGCPLPNHTGDSGYAPLALLPIFLLPFPSSRGPPLPSTLVMFFLSSSYWRDREHLGPGSLAVLGCAVGPEARDCTLVTLGPRLAY